jgi:hypothetical protein
MNFEILKIKCIQIVDPVHISDLLRINGYFSYIQLFLSPNRYFWVILAHQKRK